MENLKLHTLKLQQKCADPFLHHKGQCRKKSLRIVPQELVNNFPDLHLTRHHRLCKQCREHYESLSEKGIDTLNSDTNYDSCSNSEPPKDLQEKYENVDNSAASSSEQIHEMCILNESLVSIGESPIKKKACKPKVIWS